FHFLHKNINTRFYLHQKLPKLITSPQCIHCPYFRRNTIDTLDHFNFLCPVNYRIWCHILSTYIDPSLTTTPQSPYSAFPALSTQQICASTLEGLWSSHWRLVFDSIPF
ncbi:uncharacterized protein B0P05DRAFT_456682, partial [Gilbertella persicaria]|uniref:uncharacterized protein n=1 Tax=Gilbertella persicaria TaxID=101096 RepID=UPI0022206D1C